MAEPATIECDIAPARRLLARLGTDALCACLQAAAASAGSFSADAADLAENDEAKFRTIEWTDSEGSTQSAKVLATAAVTIPSGSGVPAGYTKQNRVTQIQWDADYHKLQIKKGNILVENDSEDADWTDLLQFVEFDE